jgi:hypothetical protein
VVTLTVPITTMPVLKNTPALQTIPMVMVRTAAPSQGWSSSPSNSKHIRRSNKRRLALGRSMMSCGWINIMTSLPVSKQPSTPS